MFFAFGLFAIGLALGRGSYAFLMRAMFDLPNGQILKNANGMSALRGGRGWLPIVVHGVGFLFGFSFFPYTLIVIALFGIQPAAIPDLLSAPADPIQKNIISPWEKMQAQREHNMTHTLIEFGSTRIKAVLIDEAFRPVASGDYTWKSDLRDGVWTYDLEEAWNGLRTALRALGRSPWMLWASRP